MSSRNRHAYKWPSPPPARNTSYKLHSTESSLRRLPEYAVPTGIVASRVRHLQSLQNSISSSRPGSTSQVEDATPSSTHSGRRVSISFGESATRSARPDEEPQIQISHSYLGHRPSRSNHWEEHAFTNREPSSERPVSSQTARTGNSVNNSPWSTPTRRRVSAYQNALKDYSRREIDRITEADSQHGGYLDLLVPSDQIGTNVAGTDDPGTSSKWYRRNKNTSTMTTSTARQESVWEMFRQHGIERPAALVFSTDPYHLQESMSTHEYNPEPNQDDHSVRDQPAGDEEQGRVVKRISAPPTPPPLPNPKGSSLSSQSSQRQGPRNLKVVTRAEDIPSTPEERLVMAEDNRHEKEKKEHDSKRRRSPLILTLKTSGEDSPPFMLTKKGHYKRQTPPSSPRKDNGSHHLERMSTQTALRKSLRKPHPTAFARASSSALESRKNSIEKNSRMSLKPGEQIGKDSPDGLREKKPKQRPGHPQLVGQTYGRVSKVSGTHAAHKAHGLGSYSPYDASSQIYSSSQSPQTYAAPDTPRTTDNSYINYIERSVSATTPSDEMSSTIVCSDQARRDQDSLTRPVQSQSEYMTSLGHQTPSMSGARMPTEEGYSFVVGRPEELPTSDFGTPARDIPRRHHSPKHHSRGTRIQGNQQAPLVRSSSTSATTARPTSTCGTPTCRATHLGHAPYRHSIACTKKRNLQHLSELVGSGYAAESSDLSEPDDAEGVSYFDLLPQRPGGKHDLQESVPDHHQDPRLPVDYHQQSRQCYTRKARHAPAPKTADQCRKCSGYLDRCFHCRDDCQCDQCQAIVEFTKNFVRQEQSRRHSAANKHPQQKKAKSAHRNIRERRDLQFTNNRPLQKPAQRSLTSSAVISPTIKSTGDELTSSSSQGQAFPGSAAGLSRLAETKAKPSNSDMVSKSQPIVSANRPVLAQNPLLKPCDLPPWTQTDIRIFPLPVSTEENPFQRPRPSLPPRSSNMSIDERTRSSNSPYFAGLQKPLTVGNTPQHSSRQIQSTVIKSSQGQKQGLVVEEDASKKYINSSRWERSTPMSHPSGLDSRLSGSQVRGATRKPSVLGTLKIQKGIIQHQKSEERAPTLSPWSLRSKIPILPPPEHRRPSSLAVASMLDYPSSFTMPNHPSSASEVVSSKSPPPPRKGSIPVRSSSEELQKNSPSVCPPRMNLRRPQRSTKRVSTRLQASPVPSHKATSLPSRPHTSMEHCAPAPRSQAAGPEPPSASALSKAVSQPKTPLSKSFIPTDVQKDDTNSSLRKVSRKISTLFKVKEKKSIAHLRQDEREAEETETTSMRKDFKDKKSKSVKLRPEELQRRKRSLKLKASKDNSQTDESQGDIMEQASSRAQGFEPTKVPLETTEVLAGLRGVSSESSSADSQNGSQGGKGPAKDLSPPNSETWSLRVVDGFSKDQKGPAIDKPFSKHPSAAASHSRRGGLVSAKVEEWNRELASLEQASSNGAKDMDNLKSKIVLRDADEADISGARDAATKSSPGEQDIHDFLWKTMHLADHERDQDKERLEKQEKLRTGRGINASETPSYSASKDKEPSVTGVTVFIHRRDRDDLVVRGGIISRA